MSCCLMQNIYISIPITQSKQWAKHLYFPLLCIINLNPQTFAKLSTLTLK